MKREDFKKIIKLRSCWRIDRRRGNYTLPNGEKLSSYMRDLVESQMELDNLGISKSGDLYFAVGGKWDSEIKEFSAYRIIMPFRKDEICSWDDMENRIDRLVAEIII